MKQTGITSHGAAEILKNLGFAITYDAGETWCSIDVVRAGKQVYFERMEFLERKMFTTPKLWDNNKVELTNAALRKKAFSKLAIQHPKEFDVAIKRISHVFEICNREKEIDFIDVEHVKMTFNIVDGIRDQLNSGETVVITPNSIYGKIIKSTQNGNT